MTTDLVVAHLADPVADIAQKMIDAHIHRVIVVDEEHRPVGIVSHTDCLAAMVRELHGLQSADSS